MSSEMMTSRNGHGTFPCPPTRTIFCFPADDMIGLRWIVTGVEDREVARREMREEAVNRELNVEARR